MGLNSRKEINISRGQIFCLSQSSQSTQRVLFLNILTGMLRTLNLTGLTLHRRAGTDFLAILYQFQEETDKTESPSAKTNHAGRVYPVERYSF